LVHGGVFDNQEKEMYKRRLYSIGTWGFLAMCSKKCTKKALFNWYMKELLQSADRNIQEEALQNRYME
jgi:hypothetical protein